MDDVWYYIIEELSEYDRFSLSMVNKEFAQTCNEMSGGKLSVKYKKYLIYLAKTEKEDRLMIWGVKNRIHICRLAAAAGNVDLLWDMGYVSDTLSVYISLMNGNAECFEYISNFVDITKMSEKDQIGLISIAIRSRKIECIKAVENIVGNKIPGEKIRHIILKGNISELVKHYFVDESACEGYEFTNEMLCELTLYVSTTNLVKVAMIAARKGFTEPLSIACSRGLDLSNINLSISFPNKTLEFMAMRGYTIPIDIKKLSIGRIKELYRIGYFRDIAIFNTDDIRNYAFVDYTELINMGAMYVIGTKNVDVPYYVTSFFYKRGIPVDMLDLTYYYLLEGKEHLITWKINYTGLIMNMLQEKYPPSKKIMDVCMMEEHYPGNLIDMHKYMKYVEDSYLLEKK